MPGTPIALCLTQPQSLLIFTARSYGDFSALWPWAGGPGMGLELLAPQGTSAAKVPLLIFHHYNWVWDPPILHLFPPYQSGCLFFIPLVIALLFSYIADGSEWWLFCSLVIILMWLWDEASITFTYFMTLTRSQILQLFNDWTSDRMLTYGSQFTQMISDLFANVPKSYTYLLPLYIITF